MWYFFILTVENLKLRLHMAKLWLHLTWCHHPNQAGQSSFWMNEFSEKLGLSFCWSYVHFCSGEVEPVLNSLLGFSFQPCFTSSIPMPLWVLIGRTLLKCRTASCGVGEWLQWRCDNGFHGGLPVVGMNEMVHVAEYFFMFHSGIPPLL